MKLYPEDGQGAGGETPAAADTEATPTPAATAPAAKTYSEEQVADFVRQAHAARDTTWSKHLADPTKGKAALAQLAALHGATIAEKQAVAEAVETGDDSDLTPREKAMLARLEKLEGVQKAGETTAAEQAATAAMQADVSRAAESIPYGRNPKLNQLIQTLILGDMVDPTTPKGMTAQKLAMGIQSGLEKVFADWVKDNGYIKDPSVAANQPLRGGSTTTAIGPNEEPKSWGDVEGQTAALLRSMKARK